MQCTFEHLSGSKKGQLEQAQGERITIGRDPANTVQFDPTQDLDVSSHHAQLAVGDDGKYMLTDLGSRNGTFLNGQKVAGTVCAEPGSKIQFGKGGPEVKIAYTPGAKKPGATRVLLAQVQQNLEEEKQKAAAGKKKAMIIAAVAGVLVLGGAGGYMAYSHHATKVEHAMTAKAACDEMAAKARKHKADTLAATKADWTKAQDADQTAQEAEKKGNWELAQAKWTEAKSLYDEANDNATKAGFKAEQDALAEQSRKAQEEAAAAAAAQLEEMKAQQDALQKKLEEETAAKEKQMRELELKMRQATDAEKRKLQELKDQLSKSPSSETAREIVKTNMPSLCFIRVESYVQPKGAKDRSVIATCEGTGFVIAGDAIAAAKHILQPWKYDSKVMATAKKIKEEHGLDVQDYVEVWMSSGQGVPFTKKYDSAAGSCKIAKTADDKWVDKSEAVTIDWNQQPTSVAGIQIHQRNLNDYAVIQVPGASLTPCALGDKGPHAPDPVLILGNAREQAGQHLISANQARGEVQNATEQVFNINATVPSTYAGAPVFRYDKQIWGIVAGTDTNNVICIPIDQVLKLKGQ